MKAGGACVESFQERTERKGKVLLRPSQSATCAVRSVRPEENQDGQKETKNI